MARLKAVLLGQELELELMQSVVVDLPTIRGAFVSVVHINLRDSKGHVLCLMIARLRPGHMPRSVLPLNGGIRILLETPFRPSASQEECWCLLI